MVRVVDHVCLVGTWASAANPWCAIHTDPRSDTAGRWKASGQDNCAGRASGSSNRWPCRVSYCCADGSRVVAAAVLRAFVIRFFPVAAAN
jgi:hypothetical protein